MSDQKTYVDVAEFLRGIGWHSRNDAQWTQLKASITKLRELVNEVYWTERVADTNTEGTSS